MKKIILALFFFSFFLLNYSIWSYDVKLIDSYELLQKDVLLQRVSRIVVTEDEMVIVSDGKAGDLKFYDNRGNLIKTFGRRGYGPDEFINPKVFDYVDSKLIINDWGRQKVYIYERTGPALFQKSREMLGFFYDIKMMQSRLLISGSKADPKGIWFSLFIQGPERKNVTFLLTAEEMLGQPPSRRPDIASNKMKELLQVGGRFYCDFLGNYVFSIWQGDLSIIKTNVKSLKISRFGVKTDNYTTPKATKGLAKARRGRNLKNYYKKLEKMSMVRKIFVTEKFVGVIYMNYDEKLSMWKPFLQLYSHEGKLLIERLLPGAVYIHYLMGFYYDKNKSILYALSQRMNGEFDTFYKIYKYKISA